jgi:major membrane immunogen (membrane-anchored lipoprotein)
MKIMKIKSIFLMLFAVVALSACSSDDTKSCEEDNFGYLQLTIPSSTNRTGITYTMVGNSSMSGEEVIAANKTSGKVDIPSGTYTIVVEQINDSGQSVSNAVTYTNVVISQCETVSRTIVSFDN